MTGSRDLAHVRACLDDPFTPHLLALADLHEEAGEDALARAYRRIAREGKVPVATDRGWGWLPGHPKRHSPTFRAVCRNLQAMGLDPVDHEAAPSQAYHALALAYAEEEATDA